MHLYIRDWCQPKGAKEFRPTAKRPMIDAGKAWALIDALIAVSA